MQSAYIEQNLVCLNPSEAITMDELQVYKILPIRNSIPVFGKRLSFFIAGPPGCGKSYTTAQILSYFPDQVKYLFTDITDDDEVFKGIKFRRIKMDKLETITLEKLSKDGDCWCVFDDVDKIVNPTISKNLMRLMDNILANGRKHGDYGNINVIITSHSLSDYKRTKYAIENSNYWVIFPSKTMQLQLETLLRKDGLQKIEKEIKDENRLFYHRSSPHFVVSDVLVALI